MYDLHLEAYVRQLIPIHRRKPKNVAFVRTLLKPLDTLFKAFADFRKEAILASTGKGQVAVLEYNCNRIAELPSGYIYVTESALVDFAVLIPPFVTQQKKELIVAYLERYKLAGKKYEIVINE